MWTSKPHAIDRISFVIMKLLTAIGCRRPPTP